MSVGDPVVDADHKHLIELINDFELASTGTINHRNVARVLLGLVEYAAEHFGREEELQVFIHYPYHDSHKEGHRQVLRKLKTIVQQYTALDGDHRDEIMRGLAGFLREWLVDHIIESDLRMKPYVIKMMGDRSQSEKRHHVARALGEAFAELRASHR